MSERPDRIGEATSDEEIARCSGVMAELRPHIGADGFVARVREQMLTGYRLAFVESGGAVVSVAGYRFGLNLAWGRHLYIDDLVTASGARSSGHAGRLLRRLVEVARDRGCDSVHLDSGVQRFGAHRFYLREGFDITSHHFAVSLR